MDGWNATPDLIALPRVKETFPTLNCLKFPIRRGFIFGIISSIIFLYYPT